MHTHTQKVLITPSEQRRKRQVQRLARAPYEGSTISSFLVERQTPVS